MRPDRRVKGIHAPPPRPTFAAKAVVAAVLSALWLGGLALVRALL